ncbi:hypothetical protein A2397_01115 [Candidatus Amesbacteria bacterium RIFOXYB1_FULL_44_23]|uniref:Uncharacterized protein n=1 Tax=Candidatus Amesbacteria bacterium RIFOXYB1_FULL_44_23 TaxID=1797263 RepID=A0A1F4ZTP4_9BACT|nr:MAG: hypothetical protein A2397_01115 [Candidatus Amesbacteria bacterium RIFOXYB1_FULL_44_23]
MSNILVAVSSVLAFVSYIVYIVAILKGEARPHRTTRFVLVIITSLAMASLLASGSSVAIWLSAVFTIGCIVIFALSIKYGMGGWAKADILCLVIALAGIVFWKVTSNPTYALLASIMSDLAGQIPMLIKTYRFPETEVWTFYALDVLAAGLSISAITQRTFQELAYPSYIVFIDGITIIFILRKQITSKVEQLLPG